LYVLEDAGTFPEAVVVASERLDGNAAWREVPDRHLISVRRGSGARLSPL
jgi:predicted glutamine amidotransferase